METFLACIIFSITAIGIIVINDIVKDPVIGFIVGLIVLIPLTLFLFFLFFQVLPLAITGLGFTIIAKMFKGN